jgi:hypothetical protein
MTARFTVKFSLTAVFGRFEYMNKNKMRLDGFVFIQKNGFQCPFNNAIFCEYVGSCDAIVGLINPCDKVKKGGLKHEYF